MIITCGECSTSFELDTGLVKPEGSKVRCSVCSSMFVVYPHGTGDAQTEPPILDTDTISESEDDFPKDSGVDEVAAFKGEEIQTSVTGAGITPGDTDDTIEEEVEENLAAFFDDEDSFPGIALESEQDNDGGEHVSIEEDLESSLDIKFEEEPFLESDQKDKELDLFLEPEEDQAIDEGLPEEEMVLDFDLEAEDDNDKNTDDTPVLESEKELNFLSEEEQVSGDTDIDEELELSLDLDFDDAPVDESDEKLEDLELALEPEDVSVSEESLEDDDFDLDFDFDLDLDDDQKEGAAVDKEALDLVLDSDDLELKGSEDVIDEKIDSGASDFEDDILDSFDLELDLEDSDGTKDEDVEDLEFDLDLELDEGESGRSISDEDLDLSDIEKMLDSSDDEESGSILDIDDDAPDVERSLETEKWSSEAGMEDDVDEEGALDLTEIEQVLDDVDFDAEDDAKGFDEDLDLDFDGILDSASDVKKEGAVGEIEALEQSEFEDISIQDEVSRVTENEDSDDLKLEFDVDEEGDLEPEANDLEETVAVPETMDFEKAQASDSGPKPRQPQPPAKKGVSKSVIFLIFLLILAGGLGGTYYVLDKNGIEIPYISQYFKPKVEDPGTLNLTTFDINSKFVDNATEGRLFVITGKVRNGYSYSSSMISLTGKLFSDNKIITGNSTVYCGNIITDLALTNLNIDAINKRLSNRFGDNRSNTNVKPGQSIPFMLVFSGLPENLEEFTIEVTGSKPLK